VGRGAGFGCVGGEGESFVGFEGHGFEEEVHAADGWVMELLESAAVEADGVGGP
jgi:hypothetical protein